MRKQRISPKYVRRMIAEERAALVEYSRYNKVLVREGRRMKAEGYSRYEINEGLMDIAKAIAQSPLGKGFIETFKYQIALKIISVIGLKPDKLLARLIANIVENADILEFKKYFGPDACDHLPALIVDAIAETGMEPFIDGFISGTLGIENNRLADSVREALTNALLSTEFLTAMKQKLTDFVCEIDVTDIVDEFKDVVIGTGDEVQDAVSGAVGGARDAMETAADVFNAATS